MLGSGGRPRPSLLFAAFTLAVLLATQAFYQRLSKMTTEQKIKRRWAEQAAHMLLANGAAAISNAVARSGDGNGEGKHELTEGVELFARFVEAHSQDFEALWQGRLEIADDRGIVISAGSPGTLVNAFVNLHVLRHTLGCHLPVTIMYWGLAKGDVPSAETMEFMQAHISNLFIVNASALAWPAWHRPLCTDPSSWQRSDGYKLKAFALYYAPYKHVMYMDSDAMPSIDPTVLFEHPMYGASGSMFWSDIWCNDTTHGAYQPTKLFQQLGMPSVGAERAAESGIFLVDRQRHWLAVEWALWLNVNGHITYALAYGDKDTFRAAFFLAGSLPAYYQVEVPVALMLEKRTDGFFHRGFLQPHPNGSAMFVHRVAEAKFELTNDDSKPITHVTIPSCRYFDAHFNLGLINSAEFQKEVIVNGPLIPDRPNGVNLVGQHNPCPYSMHTLYDATKQCGGYNWDDASGNDKLPVFKIFQEGHVGRANEAAGSALKLARDSIEKAGHGSRLFKLPI